MNTFNAGAGVVAAGAFRCATQQEYNYVLANANNAPANTPLRTVLERLYTKAKSPIVANAAAALTTAIVEKWINVASNDATEQGELVTAMAEAVAKLDEVPYPVANHANINCIAIDANPLAKSAVINKIVRRFFEHGVMTVTGGSIPTQKTAESAAYRAMIDAIKHADNTGLTANMRHALDLYCSLTENPSANVAVIAGQGTINSAVAFATTVAPNANAQAKAGMQLAIRTAFQNDSLTANKRIITVPQVANLTRVLSAQENGQNQVYQEVNAVAAAGNVVVGHSVNELMARVLSDQHQADLLVTARAKANDAHIFTELGIGPNTHVLTGPLLNKIAKALHLRMRAIRDIYRIGSAVYSDERGGR